MKNKTHITEEIIRILQQAYGVETAQTIKMSYLSYQIAIWTSRGVLA